MAIDNYYYNEQIEKYIVQFMSIFTGMSIHTGIGATGEISSIRVPVHYGSKDRVTSSILSDNTQNKPMRLPVMSCYLRSLAMAPERYKGVGAIRTSAHVPRGGLIPDDIKVVHQYMPIPYMTTLDLSIYTSNLSSHFQILEQILVLFDPILQIQTSDGAFDWGKITTVELRDITFEENYPAATDRRMIVTTLNFEMPIYISAPARLKSEIINDIYLRIGSVDTFGNGSQDILDQLDDQGLEYDLVVSAARDLGIK
jgi:hypothetical protein